MGRLHRRGGGAVSEVDFQAQKERIPIENVVRDGISAADAV